MWQPRMCNPFCVIVTTNAPYLPPSLHPFVQVERVLRSQVLHLQQQVDQLNSKQVELLGQKQALQIAHQQEVARYGHLKTAEELQSMLAALQKEVDTNAGHARKAAVSRHYSVM